MADDADSGAAVLDAGADAASAGLESSDEGDRPIDRAVFSEKGGVPTQPKGPHRSPFADPTKESVSARVGLVPTNIEDFDFKTGTFRADFFLSLTSDRPMPPVDLHFGNGQAERTVLADRPTFKLFRYSGSFSTDVDLRNFPFDEQGLVIELEEDDSGIDQLQLVADPKHTYFDTGFSIVGWEVASLEAKVYDHFFPDRFDDDDLYYSRYVARIGIARHSRAGIFEVFLPAFVIVLIALFGVWVPPNEMEVRMNAGAPMLAAAVLFHFTLMQELPATSYLTRADKLMIGTYASLLMGIASTWVFFLVDERHWPSVLKWGKRLVPIGNAIAMGLASVL